MSTGACIARCNLGLRTAARPDGAARPLTMLRVDTPEEVVRGLGVRLAVSVYATRRIIVGTLRVTDLVSRISRGCCLRAACPPVVELAHDLPADRIVTVLLKSAHQAVVVDRPDMRLTHHSRRAQRAGERAPR
jgi:hypothetical protein